MSFVFSLLAIVLLDKNISTQIVIALTYFFVGFFVVFRTLTFVNLYDQKKGTLHLCAIGLMYSRIMEGLLNIFQAELTKNYTLLIVIEAVMLCIVLWVYLLYYLKNNRTPNDKIKELSAKYKLSAKEEKVLELLIQDNTKKEIADKLYLSVNTIKIHVTNIYKKTGMTRTELREKCNLRAE
jgi:DNA-binding CsgD family transcriptional regulator